MSMKKLFVILVIVVILCIGAIVYLLSDTDTKLPIIDNEEKKSGESIDPGISIVLSGDSETDTNEEDQNKDVLSGENVFSSGDANFSGDVEDKDEENKNPDVAPIEQNSPEVGSSESTLPEHKNEDENNETPVPNYLEPSVNNVEDSFVEEVKKLLEPGKYKFYLDSEKMVYVLKDSQVMVYEYQGNEITGYKKYDVYDSEFIAKIIADSNNGPEGPSLSTVKKVTYCDNFVIWEYSAEEYSKYTVKDIKAMYSQYQIK